MWFANVLPPPMSDAPMSDAFAVQHVSSRRNDAHYICCAMSSDYLVLGASDGVVEIRDLHTGGHRRIHAHTKPIQDCLISRTGRPYLVTVSDDCTSKIWDLSTDTCLHTLPGQTSSCALSSDGMILAIGFRRTVLWNVQTGAPICRLQDHADYIYGCTFSSDDQLFASISSRNIINVWQHHTGVLLRVLVHHKKTASRQGCLFSSRDPNMLVTLSQDDHITFWNVRSGVCLFSINYQSTIAWYGFSPDGRCLTIVAGHNMYIRNIYSHPLTLVACYCHLSDADSAMIRFSYSPHGLFVGVHSDHTYCIRHVPHYLNPRAKVLLFILIGNRHHRMRLPAELWKWMEDEWFY